MILWKPIIISHAPGLNLNSTGSGLLRHNQFPQSPEYHDDPHLYAFVIHVIPFREISPSKFDVVSLGCDRHPPQTDLMGLMLIIISVTRIRNVSAHFLLFNFFHINVVSTTGILDLYCYRGRNFRGIRPDKISTKHNHRRCFCLLSKRDVGRVSLPEFKIKSMKWCNK